MRCPHCMSEGVARIEDERVKRACALGLGLRAPCLRRR